MPTAILATKLYIPPPRPGIVPRPRLVERLNEGQAAGRTPGVALISAPAGFGKTTLVSEWIVGCGQPVAWLSLDHGDNDLSRFLTYLVAAIQTVAANIGKGVLAILESPQPPPTESILTTLLNNIATISDSFILVLDDYHVIDSQAVGQALVFLVEHLPPQMHLVIATREDPSLPLARMRVHGQLIELRAADLRFTPSEAAEFLNRVMGLSLSEEDIAALETRTEGWIAGLQLAAISMQGLPDAASFIQSFTGSHRFVLDYLLEEVLQRQSVEVQKFLLCTSILERLCGPLCDAVLRSSIGRGGETLTAIERANLFIIPLDNERRWYRYHHLFADLLRQRLGKDRSSGDITEFHIRASEWYENNSLLFEAFHHATLANDVERAERLIESREMGLHLFSVVMPILDWLASLPKTVLNSRPGLCVRSATLALMAGQTNGVEEKLQAAENALQGVELDEKTRDLIGQVACARATLALTRYEPEAMLTQARRALEYLSPEDLPYRFTANWALTSASLLQGDRATAARACLEGISISQKSGDIFSIILANTNLGRVRELENQLYQAAEAYRRVLELSGEHPHPNAGEVHLGLARIHYQWNELDAAEQHGLQSLQLTRQFDRVIDRFILSEVFLAQLKLAQGEVSDAEARLAQTEQTARLKNYLLRMPDIAAAQVLVLLRQGQLAAAAHLAQQYDLPLCQARVFLAQGNPSAALVVLEPLRQQMAARGWQDEQLKVLVLQSVALYAHGEKNKAVQLLRDALTLAKPGGFIRLFVDEGAPMAQVLLEAASHGIMPDDVGKLLAAFEAEKWRSEVKPDLPPASLLIEPLSQRELKIIKLIAQGLSNREISERLFLALDTIKGHNRRIFDKLQVQNRTEAVARARELGLLQA
jgi:LuxR family transcriptional regulator, maltose regulon positive regulatory protein